MNPEGLQRTQNDFSRYQDFDMSLVMGFWVGDLKAAVPVVPHLDTFLSRELAALEY